MPEIKIVAGKEAGWKRQWLSCRTYVVSLPRERGRTKFKKAYREALAGCFLEEVRRQNPRQYKALMKAGGLGYGRGARVRAALADIIQQGSKKAATKFEQKAKVKKNKAEAVRHGKTGLRLLDALWVHGGNW
ncbi:hypothetical protein [uncultured Litoreibacter sp.]|uniref:hypothetical protein n=1 Tax=uncultured Litoreibacter sp. TaxID=1392394 RepID=UPI00262F9189|nr:hypothetical protein [uncultured Litoreibacter sp.]